MLRNSICYRFAISLTAGPDLEVYLRPLIRSISAAINLEAPHSNFFLLLGSFPVSRVHHYDATVQSKRTKTTKT